MRRRLPVRQWFLVIFLAALAGCTTTPDRFEVLDNVWKNYEKAMLWGEYSYCLDAHKGNPVTAKQLSHLKSIKVTGYEVMKKEVTPDKNIARQLVEIKYYNKAYAVVRTINVDQEWLYEPKSNQWVILTPFPDFQ
ncbi:MAG: hypothetical protein OEZ39_12410 [Gammaproteobacteria bacterium]|nr:hypothetical protein [Gammaproteobacteria bacterium]MDH5652648.1 hypothetical protein [Gammaproteobacteria bacterium]